MRPESKVRSPASARRRHSALPFVLINMAMTADGKIATANRAVSTFGSAHDHENLLALRATADAVMAGARTVDSNPINLGPGPAKFRRRRLQRDLAEYNLRVVVSGSGSISSNAELFRQRFSPIIIITSGRASAATVQRLRSLADAVKACGATAVDFPAALRWLRRRWGVRRLVCEGGGELNDALLRGGLVNELHITVCPKIFGDRHAPTIADGHGFPSLSGAVKFQLKSARRIADEMFLVFERRTSDANR